MHSLSGNISPRRDSIKALFHRIGPATIAVAGTLEASGHAEIILPAIIRHIDGRTGARPNPNIQLEGSNDTRRPCGIFSIYCNDDVSGRPSKSECITLSDSPICMSPNLLTIDVKRILVIRADDNRAAGGWYITGHHNVLAERAVPGRCVAARTANLVCPNPF